LDRRTKDIIRSGHGWKIRQFPPEIRGNSQFSVNFRKIPFLQKYICRKSRHFFGRIFGRTFSQFQKIRQPPIQFLTRLERSIKIEIHFPEGTKKTLRFNRPINADVLTIYCSPSSPVVGTTLPAEDFRFLSTTLRALLKPAAASLIPMATIGSAD
jgi:hypothetical protein